MPRFWTALFSPPGFRRLAQNPLGPRQGVSQAKPAQAPKRIKTKRVRQRLCRYASGPILYHLITPKAYVTRCTLDVDSSIIVIYMSGISFPSHSERKILETRAHRTLGLTCIGEGLLMNSGPTEMTPTANFVPLRLALRVVFVRLIQCGAAAVDVENTWGINIRTPRVITNCVTLGIQTQKGLT